MPGEPTTIDEIRADTKMMNAYLAYARKRAILNEITFYFDKGNNEAIYARYLDPKSKDAANIDARVSDAAEELAARGDWKNAAWNRIISAGKKQVGSALNGDIGGFLNSKEYADYLKTEKMGDPAKAAKLLGIKDVKKLREAMEALVTGDTAGARKLFEKIAKDEEMAEKAETIIKALQKAGLA